jgi:methylenetetrahydrofolate dehydrogenase (NADP+)/methenyltetrahydrofolate cyclohydrolase
METIFVDGKALSEKILASVASDLAKFSDPPRLAVIAFGEGSAHYIQQKRRAAERVGAEFHSYILPARPGSNQARAELNKVVRQSHAHAVVVQLPLPEGVGNAILNVIPPEKDPDLLSDRSIGLFFNGRLPITPPTAEAVLTVLRQTKTTLNGKTASLFGHGHLVGKFLVPLLLAEQVIVRIVSHKLELADVQSFTRGSDIIISATGDPLFLKAEHLPVGAAVIDAGFSLLDGRIVGDIDFANAESRFTVASQVPGGIGPVGVANLFKNIATLYSLYHQ